MNDAAHSSILVVEDDPAVRNLVTTALDLHGYSVEKATDGETAIMDAASRNPDLIMLDLGLPDIDGVEVINKIRSWSAVPIIVISARVSVPVLSEAITEAEPSVSTDDRRFTMA